MNEISSKNPVFIHSLWRGASTYFFATFRRCEGVFAYQEPLHELVLAAAGQPELLVGTVSSDGSGLRHPNMDFGYFHELALTHSAWKDTIAKDLIYDRYFVVEPDLRLAAFFQSLIGAAPRRPVIQECRCALRIGGLKEALGGTHLSLVRNPRDQWLSCKINLYFDAVIQLLQQGQQVPRSLRRLWEKNRIIECNSDEIADEIRHFMRWPLKAEDSYRAFFTIWCMVLRHARKYADLVIFVDYINKIDGKCEEVERQIAEVGAGEVSLRDCDLFMSQLPEGVANWFHIIERDVFNDLAIDGFEDCEIRDAVATVNALEDLRLEVLVRDPERSLRESLDRTQRMVLDLLDHRQQMAAMHRDDAWAKLQQTIDNGNSQNQEFKHLMVEIDIEIDAIAELVGAVNIERAS